MAPPIAPDVLWAQRSSYVPDDNYVVLTIEIPDVAKEDLKLDIQDKKVTLDAHSHLKHTEYHLELDLHDDVYPKETKINHTDRHVELTLYKAEPDCWWPALLSGDQMPHNVKQDFDKWVNKDDQDGETDSEEEFIAGMDKTELSAMADNALSLLPDPVFDAITHEERQSKPAAPDDSDTSRNSDADDDDESDDGSDTDDEDQQDDSGSDDDDSGNDNPPPGDNAAGGSSSDNVASGGRDSASGGRDPTSGGRDPPSKGSGKGSSSSGNDSPCGDGSPGGGVYWDRSRQNWLLLLGWQSDWSDNLGGIETMFADDDVVSAVRQGQKKHSSRRANARQGRGGVDHKKHPSGHVNDKDHDWANYLNGVRPMLFGAGRKLPVDLRPIDFQTWKRRVDRTVELRNFCRSPFMRLPKELRLRIYSLALVMEKPVHFCPQLHECYEEEYEYLSDDQKVWGQNHGRSDVGKPWRLKELVALQLRAEFHCYFKGFDTKRCPAPGLLTVSRAVHREATKVLYQENTFAFHDMHGFVALECFLRTIGHKSIKHLRQLEIHTPIWHHGRHLDRLRSTWILKSAGGFGLVRANPHKDRVRGSFEACFKTLVSARARLKQLHLIIPHAFVQQFMVDVCPEEAVLPKNKKLVYGKRVNLEETVYSRLLASVPDWTVTFVAQNYPEGKVPTTQDETQLFEESYSRVEQMAKKFGFGYKRSDMLIGSLRTSEG